jgi:hypothetical protein
MNKERQFHAIVLIVVAVLAILLNAAVAHLIYSVMELDAQRIADHVIAPDQRTITENVIVGMILAVALQSAGFILVFGRFLSSDIRIK